MKPTNKFNKVLSLDKSMKIGSMKEEWFQKVMVSTNFEQAAKGTGMDVCRCFFNSIWGSISHILQTNEALIEDQDKVMKKYADLIEEHKLLELEVGKFNLMFDEALEIIDLEFGIEYMEKNWHELYTARKSFQEAGDDKTEGDS